MISDTEKYGRELRTKATVFPFSVELGLKNGRLHS